MLDNTTKKNIDDCRDVLVGKVPDPKSQIEQITLALIYKFMDDMDKEAVEKFKGKPKFFTGEYSKYGWRKLFDPALSGADMLALYSDALDKLNTNPNIPELFRNIFKNAYLPYRDPATLKLFLKHINAFEYSHSEKLGDAFEYLLSVMGSQGDAGQFRTPRHIIDFVTACVDPQKGETVLDPACGTAGFLLSAYKHILNHNTDKRQGDKLKPEERKKLSENIVGYDISPDMVRLSLANMYLHGFSTPEIHEYDTLSSEDRWNETYDVILANPPFMTPKGGIRPHKKFGVQANKAEVLFTDYIAEHLNQNGRAGIVVPNGIVATSQTAYKQLRRMLIEDSLIAVISLPAGCFNPYSGVKTSVLILDKALSKKTDKILFLKIENDGYDLGAQRREHDKNDLPLALLTLYDYKKCLNDGSKMHELPELANVVERKVILEQKDVVLSAERYFETKAINSNYDLVKLHDERYFKIESGGTPSSEEESYWNGSICWATLKDLPASDFITILHETERKITDSGLAKSSAKLLPVNSVLISSRATIGRIAINKVPLATNQGFKNIVIQDFNKVIPEYLAFVITHKVPEMIEMSSGSTFKEISKSSIGEIEIPLPPLEIQQQIVAEIESYQKIIDGAKLVVENYKPVIKIKPEWEMVELGSLAKLVGGSTPSKENTSYWDNGKIDWITCSDFSSSPMFIEDSIRKISELAVKESSTNIVPEDTLVLVTRVSLGKLAFVRKPTALNQDLTALVLDETKANKKYIYFYLYSISDKIARDGHGATVKGVTRDYVKDILIPLPDLNVQEKIVEEIEQELKMIESNKKLISLFDNKIKIKINEVWGVSLETVQENAQFNMVLEVSTNY